MQSLFQYERKQSVYVGGGIVATDLMPLAGRAGIVRECSEGLALPDEKPPGPP
jgi:hypothetical protein